MNAVHPQALGDFHKQDLVIEIRDLLRPRLGQIERHAINAEVGFARVDETRDDEAVHPDSQAEPLQAVDRELPPIIGDQRHPCP